MSEDRITRHKWPSRLLHWLMAAAILTLLVTSLLPIVGIKFEWLVIHWVAGLVLAALVLLHTIRALFFQRPGRMGLGLRDARMLAASAGIGRSSAPRPGKYSVAQKAMHHAIAIAALVAIATGFLMLAKIDTPFWERNPYLLPEATWGLVYVAHDFAALSFVTLIMLHIYFALRPEKFLYLRAMTLGWIRKDELEAHHDPERWDGDDGARK